MNKLTTQNKRTTEEDYKKRCDKMLEDVRKLKELSKQNKEGKEKR